MTNFQKPLTEFSDDDLKKASDQLRIEMDARESSKVNIDSIRPGMSPQERSSVLAQIDRALGRS